MRGVGQQRNLNHSLLRHRQKLMVLVHVKQPVRHRRHRCGSRRRRGRFRRRCRRTRDRRDRRCRRRIWFILLYLI